MTRALYRKYRSKTFDELLGQDHVVRTLKQQVVSGEISHAYVFSGTRGTGKTSAAKIMSRAVNCLNTKDGNPCNECDNCTGVLKETVFDVVEMDAASNNSVDDIRDLREKAIYPPSHLRYKVYIIDEVHMLSKGAFNALLKLLEEPPEHLIFILCTTEPERIPATILSRCQRFDFKRISTADMILQMKKIRDAEGINMDEGAMRLVARNADGAMRDCLSLMDQLVSSGSELIDERKAAEILGVADEKLFFDIFSDLASGDLKGILHRLNEVLSRGKDPMQLAKDLIRHVRNMLVAGTVKDCETLLDGFDAEAYEKAASLFSKDDLVRIMDILYEMERDMKFSSQARIHIEMAFIGILTGGAELGKQERTTILDRPTIPESKLKVDSGVDVIRSRGAKSPGYAPLTNGGEVAKDAAEKATDRIFEKVPKQPDTASEVSKPEEKVQSDKGDDSGAMNIKEIRSLWDDVLSVVRKKKVMLHAVLIEANVSDVKGGTLFISFGEDKVFHMGRLIEEGNMKILKECLKEVTGIDFELRVNLLSLKSESDRKAEEIQDIFSGSNVIIYD